MRRRRRRGPILLVLGLAAALFALWPVPVLSVRAAGVRTLWRQPLRDTMHLSLAYTHSVERTPVVEIYEADARGLRLVRMEFVSQGAGLPTEGFVREGDRFVLRTDRLLRDLPVRVSALARPQLLVAGRSLDLVALAGEGAVVVVAVVRRPRVAVLWGVLY